MSAFEDIFEDYSEQMSDFVRANKLYCVFIAHAHDGTEVYSVVDQELRDIEHQSAATRIERALLQYRDCIPVHAAVELVCKLRESGEL
jgi:hypothetical protein